MVGTITAVINRTGEAHRIESEFQYSRCNLPISQLLAGIAAVLTSLAILLIGIRLLARMYITDPINELGTAAQSIMDGTNQGKVEIDPESDYAPIQSPLQSCEAGGWTS